MPTNQKDIRITMNSYGALVSKVLRKQTREQVRQDIRDDAFRMWVGYIVGSKVDPRHITPDNKVALVGEADVTATAQNLQRILNPRFGTRVTFYKEIS